MEFPDFEKPSSPCFTSTCMHEGHVLDSSCHRGMQDHRFEGSNVPILLVSPTTTLPRCMVCNGSSMRCNAPRPPHLLPPLAPWTPPFRTRVQLPPSFPPSPSFPLTQGGCICLAGASAPWDQVRSPPSLSLRFVGCDEVNSIENSRCGISFGASPPHVATHRSTEGAKRARRSSRREEALDEAVAAKNEREEACHVHAAEGPSKKREVHQPSKDHDV